MKSNDLLQEALGLPEADKLRLVSSLLESLDAGSEESVEKAWRVAVARRVQEIDAGSVQMIPWEEAAAEIFKA